MPSETSTSPSDAPLRPRCPGCGYDLAGLIEADDQRCPECGRAWGIDELAAQHAAAGKHIDPLAGPGGWFRWLGPPAAFLGGFSLLGIFALRSVFGLPFLLAWIAVLSLLAHAVLRDLDEAARARRLGSGARGRLFARGILAAVVAFALAVLAGFALGIGLLLAFGGVE